MTIEEFDVVRSTYCVACDPTLTECSIKRGAAGYATQSETPCRTPSGTVTQTPARPRRHRHLRHLRGLRLARKVAAQPPLKRFLIEETLPGETVDTDEALLDYIRQNGQTSYHPVGTCRMGSDPESVVDPECRVRSVDGLRVVDASIMPFIVSSNTNAPAIAIGERASQMILAQSNR